MHYVEKEKKRLKIFHKNVDKLYKKKHALEKCNGKIFMCININITISLKQCELNNLYSNKTFFASIQRSLALDRVDRIFKFRNDK